MESELRKIRRERELSQEALARKARIAQTSVSQYERGERPVPRRVAERLARILRTDVQTLFTDAEAGR
ncbi:MAG: helix-turn-helix domain-containing protein [Desulfobacteria bacterium]